MDGAARAFRARGVSGSTVQDVLAEAGISRRTFYQYFASKDDVLAAVYALVIGEMVETIRTSVSASPSAAGKVYAALHAYLAYQTQGGPLLIALQAIAVNPEGPLAAVRESTLDALSDLVEESVEGALGVRLDPLAYRALLIGIEGLVLHLQTNGTFTTEDSARVEAVAVPLFLGAVARSAQLPPPGD